MWFWLSSCIKRSHFYAKVVSLCWISIFSPLLLAHAPSPPLLASNFNGFDEANFQESESALQVSLAYHLQNGHLPLLGVSLLNSPTLYDFYRERGFSRIWDSLYREQDTLQQLLAYLQQVHLHGLLASDYHFRTLMERCQIPTQELVAECDLLQTDAILSLTKHLLSGKINPNLIYKDTEVPKVAIDLTERLNSAIHAPSLINHLKKLEPQSQDYQSLKEYLASLSSRVAPDWPQLDLQPSIKPQMSDPRLEAIAERLIFWGDLSEDWYHHAPLDVLFDDDLVNAVAQFQSRHGLEPDGVLGKRTLSALNITPQQRMEQLAVNLERIRWHQLKPVTRLIIVNIASFELLALENGKESLRMLVIVGQLNRQTPIFEDTIQYLVLNPTWVVPWELATKDKLPLIQENPQYLLDNQFSVYLQDFKVEDPSLIDWKKVSRSNFPYRLVQAPGDNNALGQVKFMFPNTYEVYLHDTPTKSLFKNDIRAFSSGCIRLQKPMELLWWLLRSDGLSDIDIENQLNKKHTNTVNLSSPVPIRMEYRTAYLGLNQTVQFRADIYQRDTKLYQALQQPAASFLLR
ncbi:L,D-transpeptidase family protein [Kangiella sp. M94]